MIVKRSISEGTAIISLNRPEKRNALNPDLIKALNTVLKELSSDDAVKNLIITGEGKSFCAGADLEYLSGMSSYSVIENQNDTAEIAQLFIQLYEYPKPVIAAVNGAAIAGGCGLASICDFVCADRINAKFGYSEVKIGFIPAVVSMFLIRRIGEGNARKLLLSGDLVDSEEAYRIGLADYISDDPLQKAVELAGKLKTNSMQSMIMTKKMIREVSSLNIHQAVEYCIQLNTMSRTSDDFINGLSNFLKK